MPKRVDLKGEDRCVRFDAPLSFWRETNPWFRSYWHSPCPRAVQGNSTGSLCLLSRSRVSRDGPTPSALQTPKSRGESEGPCGAQMAIFGVRPMDGRDAITWEVRGACGAVAVPRARPSV